MALPALTEVVTAVLRGTGADPLVSVPAPREVFLAYCAGDVMKSTSLLSLPASSPLLPTTSCL